MNLYESINKNLKESNEYNWKDDIIDISDTDDLDLVYNIADNIVTQDKYGDFEGRDHDEAVNEEMSNFINIFKINKSSRLYKLLLDWYGSKEKLDDNVRDIYETNDSIYFITGCNYAIYDKDLLGGDGDGTTQRKFDDFVDGKLNESETLKEGAGAGYHVSGEIVEATVNSFNIDKEEVFNKFGDRTFEVSCDIDVSIDDLAFESYYYGSKLDFSTNAKITKLSIDDNGMDDEHPELTADEIKSALEGSKFKVLIGGGYVHTTFNGEINGDIDGYMYSNFQVTNINMKLTNDIVINFIDKKVAGDLDTSTYDVLDDDLIYVESFDDEDEAIKYAKENGYARVDQVAHDYTLVDDQGSEDDLLVDPFIQTVWSRDEEV